MIKPPPANSRNMIETVLVLFLLIALLVALYDTLHLFFGVFTFALIFSVSFSNAFERLAGLFKNRRKLAAVIYSILLIGIIAIPLGFLFASFARNIRHGIVFLNDIKENGLPPLPGWIAHLPYLGDEASSFWNNVQGDPREIIGLHQQQLKGFAHHVMTSGLGILGVFFQVIVGIITSSLFLVNQERVLSPIRATLTHLLGDQSGPALMDATAMSIKGVSVGVMGTAFIAAITSWIGLTIAGVSFAIGLSAIIFFLVIIQLGPLIVWIPLTIWMSTLGNPGMLIFIIAWGILIVIIDFVVKPILIAKSGGKIPFLILFLGVVGGIAAWGFTGMFKGAIILSVFYTVFNSWLERKITNPSEESDTAALLP
jgi:predicted PurR-regulated permease PerM